MKLNAGRRILMFFHWLFSLLICAAFAAWIIAPEWTMNLYNKVFGRLSATQVMIIGIAILAIYVILAVVQACMIFHRGKRYDRGFITVDSSDTGRVRIAVSAIEQMVRQSVISIDGLSDMKIGIDSRDDAIAININATLQNGSHVPTVTVNMQRAIRQFVEMNCGVAVRSVSISINAVTTAPETGRRWGRRKDDVKPMEAPAAFTPAYEPAAEPIAEPVVEPAAEPEVVAEATVETAEPEEDDGPVFIPDPEPIRLHFDHLPETPETPTEDATVSAEEPEAPGMPDD
ncbi:MAG: alkaline shock response membrane anchor protein AmaP [Clostridia bacterium]|nr:alkaline shock response membrane anchor protein AmaP [Clostridia bacterium]